MNFTTSERSQETVINLSGTLTFDDHDAFKGVVSAIEGASAGTVIMDMSGVKMIDSAGIGMLLLANDRARSAKKALKVGGAGGNVQKVIEVSRLHDLIPAA